MVFSSAIFLFVFLPGCWLINKFLPIKVSNVFLCIASLVFYAWGEPVYILILIFLVLVNYLLAKGINESRFKKARLVLGLTSNISTLFIFKYTDFTLETLNFIPGVNVPLPGILLPIGISFFTFQAMSYLIDVYRGVCVPQSSYIKLLLYVSFFPQLVAGPIIYYCDIEKQIESRKITSSDTAIGIRRFILGLAKKILIADTLAVAVDAIFALEFNHLTLPVTWIGATAYILQLYFDFSGYSDMALGLARMFGFRYKENFNYPYISSNIQEFWRRWHISLSTWFRDYVYIPLGGNRKGELRTTLNKTTVFLLTGLWHGAEWTFVIWGLIHGVLLLFEQYAKPFARLGKKTKWVGNVYTIFMVTLAFVIFRSGSFTQAIAFLGNMFGGGLNVGGQKYLQNPMFITAFCWGAIFSIPWLRIIKRKIEGGWMEKVLVPASYATSIVLLILCMFSISSQTYNPFIYFRF